MSENPEEAEVPADSSQSNKTLPRNAQRSRGRKFFQHLQPSFTVELPKRPTKIEFLDDNDPEKATIVRKKAREWVNQNRDKSKKARQKQQRSEATVKVDPEQSDEGQVVQVERMKSNKLVVTPSPLRTAGPCKIDPFSSLPDLGAKYNHILEYFLNGCPGRSPFGDGKQTRLIPVTRSTSSRTQHSKQHSLIPFTSANTMLGALLHSKVTCSLFLYSIACIRVGVGATTNMTEVYYFYHNSLTELQTSLNRESETGVYSDDMLLSLGVITGIAVFIGMFNTSIMHRAALIRVLSLRGNGDILAGLHSTSYWPRETIKWMEILVSIQLIETPQIPYYPHPIPPLPARITREAALRTTQTLAQLPPLSNELQHIIHLLHILGTAYSTMPPGQEIDTAIANPLYAAQFSLLQVLEAQKNMKDRVEPFEVLLADTLQLYFVVGPRGNPPTMRIFDLLVERVGRALVWYLGEDGPDGNSTAKYMKETGKRDRSVNQMIAWSLVVGVIVSAWMERKEYVWFKGHVRAHCRAMGLHVSEEEWRGLLGFFPTTEGFVWLDVWGVWREVCAVGRTG